MSNDVLCFKVAASWVQVFESGPQGEATVAVPDRAVGAIIGKGGEVCWEASHAAACLLRCWLLLLPLAAPAIVGRSASDAWFLWSLDVAAADSAAPAYVQVINQIKNVVGVRIRVSGRDEYIEGTRDRSVTISGPKKGVAIAEQLVRGGLRVVAAAAQFHGTCHDPIAP